MKFCQIYLQQKLKIARFVRDKKVNFPQLHTKSKFARIACDKNVKLLDLLRQKAEFLRDKNEKLPDLLATKKAKNMINQVV